MTFIAWFAMIPFLLLSLMAPGTMTVADADGLPRIVICTGSGPLEMIVGKDGDLRLPGDQPTERDSRLCDWSLHGQTAVDLSIPALPAVSALRIPIAHIAFQDQIRRRPSVFIRLARAPPPVLA
ncbi:DUF2946 family protein [Labrenzia sp. 011]|uniref:DUF2946 family protein n=1 Tax=Labrenzia sp. 011 TaxID=2171494 RepID=UPI001FCABB26|nr:DUF2946 family protein [Labrenzia sp. 011]